MIKNIALFLLFWVQSFVCNSSCEGMLQILYSSVVAATSIAIANLANFNPSPNTRAQMAPWYASPPAPSCPRLEQPWHYFSCTAGQLAPSYVSFWEGVHCLRLSSPHPKDYYPEDHSCECKSVLLHSCCGENEQAPPKVPHVYKNRAVSEIISGNFAKLGPGHVFYAVPVGGLQILYVRPVGVPKALKTLGTSLT